VAGLFLNNTNKITIFTPGNNEKKCKEIYGVFIQREKHQETFTLLLVYTKIKSQNGYDEHSEKNSSFSYNLQCAAKE